jgi:hypothetical protein
MAEPLDRKNKKAENLNPDRTGMRSGNPQLDTPSKPSSNQVKPEKPHAPPGSKGRAGQDPIRGR